jgi:hypothetical protein
MSPIVKRAFRVQRVMARRTARPIRMTEPIQTSNPIHTTGMTQRTSRSRSHRSDAMYLLNEAMARARCAERPPRQASRPAREVAMEARRRRGSR